MAAAVDKIIRAGVEFSNASHVQFITDMEPLYKIRIHKVYGYAGPCVRVKSATDILKRTTVKCHVKHYTHDCVVYPTETCKIVEGIVNNQPWLIK